MNKRIDRTGEKFIDKNGCEFIIVVYNKNTDVWIEFQDEYKARIHTNYKACRDKEVKNPYFNSVFGNACIGLMSDGNKPITSIKGKNTREYILWRSMIQRCYDEKYHEKQPSYKDATVCKRWLVFAQFLNDLPLIEGYDYWLEHPNERVALDKDIKGNGSKVYCLENCCFITCSNNSKERVNRLGANKPIDGIKIYGINTKTGEKTKIYESTMQVERELGICHQNVSKCLNGKCKTTGGYRWYKIDDEN